MATSFLPRRLRTLLDRDGGDWWRGKAVLVTGGSRGLGLEIARRAADRGARIAICGRNPETLEAARADIAGRAGEVFAVPCDVGDAAAVQAMVAAVSERFGGIDVLIAAAGVITVGPVEEQRLADFREAMDVMYWGLVHPALAVLPQMRERRRGSIAAITSIGGKVAMPHLLPYAGAKFAAVGFSEGLRAEEAGHGVRLTTIVPGLMRTGSHENARFKGQHRKEAAWFSLGAGAPLLSVSVERAAERVLHAVERGKAEVSIGLPAVVASRVQGLAPATTQRLLAAVERLLPEAGGIGPEEWLGAESGSAVTDSPATLLGRKAAEKQNQRVGTRRTAARRSREES